MSYGYDYEMYEGDAPYAADPASPHVPAPAPPADPQSDPSAGRGRRRRATPEPAPDDPQWEHSGLGWDQQEWNRAQYEQQEQYAADQFQYGDDQHRADHRQSGQHQAGHLQYASDQYAPERLEQYGGRYAEPAEPVQERAEVPAPTEFDLEFDSEPQTAFQRTSAGTAGDAVVAAAPASATAADTGTAAPSAGRGAFGAAGLAVVTAIGAIAATPVLATVIALCQIGLAVGWIRSVGVSHARRTVFLVAAIGLAASVLAYRLVPDRAPAAIGAALGAGFVFLAADQLFRRESVAGWPRSEALAAAATGAAFTVLPAGYLVAQRVDSALAGACALAAAVAVLCSALVGGGTRPTGILAGAVAAAAVGTLTAVSLNASAGSKGGAMGGLISGLFAVIGARTADRLATEGSDVRISAQALPMAYSAIGAFIAAQVLR